MQSDKPGIMIYFTMWRQLEELPDIDFRRMMNAVFRYGETGEIPDFSDNRYMASIWAGFKAHVESDDSRYSRVRISRKYGAYCKACKNNGLTPLSRENWEIAGRPTYTQVLMADKDNPVAAEVAQVARATSAMQTDTDVAYADCAMHNVPYTNTISNTVSNTISDTVSFSSSSTDPVHTAGPEHTAGAEDTQGTEGKTEEDGLTMDEAMKELKRNAGFYEMEDAMSPNAKKELELYFEMIAAVCNANPGQTTSINGLAVTYGEISERLKSLTVRQLLRVRSAVEQTADIKNPWAYTLTLMYNEAMRPEGMTVAEREEAQAKEEIRKYMAAQRKRRKKETENAREIAEQSGAVK